MRPIGILVLTLLSARIVLADVCLQSDSDVRIREEGDFDTAGGWLTSLLERNLLRIVKKERLSGTGTPVEIVLRTEAPHWQQLPKESRQRITQIDAYSITIRSQPTAQITIAGKTPVAVGYGVLAFLEDKLGMHWAFPGELGVCLPKESTFSLKDGTTENEPWVFARAMSGLLLREGGLRHSPAQRQSGVLMEERGFFLAGDYFKSLRLRGQSITHNMNHLFPVEECLASHPEVLPKQMDGTPFVPQTKQRGGDGGKNAYQAWHPCYTEPATLKIAIAKGREQFDQGRLFFSLGINDGKRFQCQCKDCLAVGWPNSYYQFVTRVADALRPDYPAQMVGVLAYGDVGIPPHDLKLPTNVLVNIAGVRKSVWQGKAPNMGTYEYIYGAGFVIPNLPLDVIQQNFRYYQQHQLQMYRAEFYPLWAFDAPKAYIIRKMLWDPDQDVRTLLRHFCDCTFGEAGPIMHRFYEHVSSWRNPDAQEGEWTPMWGKIWPFREPLQFSRTPQDFHHTLFEYLDQARACDLSAPQRQRIEMIAAFTKFSATYFEMWKLKERVLGGMIMENDSQRALELRSAGAALVEGFEDHPEWFLGSSVKADGFYSREWPVSELEQQMTTVAATAACSAAERALPRVPSRDSRIQFAPLRREEHSWYKSWQSQPMVLDQRIVGGFTFHSRMNESIHNEEDDRYDGEVKFQWLHANAKNLSNRPERTLPRDGEFRRPRGIAETGTCQQLAELRNRQDRACGILLEVRQDIQHKNASRSDRARNVA